MRPTRFYVSNVADGWDVLSPHEGSKRYPSRLAAVQAAQDAAQALWELQRVASEVMINEDDGAWHLVSAYGQLLDI